MENFYPKTRIELHLLFKNIIGNNVYFQPPETVKLQYPCIIYKLDDISKRYASDKTYGIKKRYSVIYITSNPDDPIPEELIKLDYCSFNRFYTADNLNHFVFEIYC